MQIGFIGYQYWQSEEALANGTLIKLELEPIDPRSFMQGDYVILNYSISQLEELKQIEPGEKLQLVLTEQNGIHQYSGVYKLNDQYNIPYEPKSGDVHLNAKANGGGLYLRH